MSSATFVPSNFAPRTTSVTEPPGDSMVIEYDMENFPSLTLALSANGKRENSWLWKIFLSSEMCGANPSGTLNHHSIDGSWTLT